MQYLLTLMAAILRIYFSTLLYQLQGLLLRPRGRTISRKERIKRTWIKSIWVVAGTIILLNSVLPVIMIIALPTTFLSFMILDEMQ